MRLILSGFAFGMAFHTFGITPTSLGWPSWLVGVWLFWAGMVLAIDGRKRPQ